jgi:hypothetical protein
VPKPRLSIATVISSAPKASGPGNPLVNVPPEWLQGDNAPDTRIDVGMHPLTLRFDDKDLEREFSSGQCYASCCRIFVSPVAREGRATCTALDR